MTPPVVDAAAGKAAEAVKQPKQRKRPKKTTKVVKPVAAEKPGSKRPWLPAVKAEAPVATNAPVVKASRLSPQPQWLLRSPLAQETEARCGQTCGVGSSGQTRPAAIEPAKAEKVSSKPVAGKACAAEPAAKPAVVAAPASLGRRLLKSRQLQR